MLIEREVMKRMQDVDLHPSLMGGWERSVSPRTLCLEPLHSHVATHSEPSCFPQVLRPDAPGGVVVTVAMVQAPAEEVDHRQLEELRRLGREASMEQMHQLRASAVVFTPRGELAPVPEKEPMPSGALKRICAVV